MIRVIPTWLLNRAGFRQPPSSIVRGYFLQFFKIFSLFAAVYTLTAFLAATRTSNYNFAFAWEAQIPIVGAAVWLYLSIVLLFVLPPFCVRRLDELKGLSRGLCAGIVIAGVIFYLFPAGVMWPRAVDGQNLPWALTYLHEIDKPFNTLPSLHVFFATVFTAFVSRRVRRARIWLWPWWAGICVSVLLVHQHHVLDIVAGAALAVFVLRLIIEPSSTCSTMRETKKVFA